MSLDASPGPAAIESQPYFRRTRTITRPFDFLIHQSLSIFAQHQLYRLWTHLIALCYPNPTKPTWNYGYTSFLPSFTDSYYQIDSTIDLVCAIHTNNPRLVFTFIGSSPLCMTCGDKPLKAARPFLERHARDWPRQPVPGRVRQRRRALQAGTEPSVERTRMMGRTVRSVMRLHSGMYIAFSLPPCLAPFHLPCCKLPAYLILRLTAFQCWIHRRCAKW